MKTFVLVSTLLGIFMFNVAPMLSGKLRILSGALGWIFGFVGQIIICFMLGLWFAIPFTINMVISGVYAVRDVTPPSYVKSIRLALILYAIFMIGLELGK